MAKKSTLDPKVTVVYQAFFDELFVKSIKKELYRSIHQLMQDQM